VRQVPIRELNQHTADVLARVESGERVQITRNGTPVAILEPAQPDPLSGLIELGELRPAQGQLPLFSKSDDSPVSDSAGLDAILQDRYGEERW
jgi:prevent-host-death family protein